MKTDNAEKEASHMTPYTSDHPAKNRLEAWKKRAWYTSRQAVERYLQKVAEAELCPSE